MRTITEDERHEVMAHPCRLLEMSVLLAPAEMMIAFETKPEARHFYIRLAATNKSKRFRPHNIWVTRHDCRIYARAPRNNGGK